MANCRYSGIVTLGESDYMPIHVSSIRVDSVTGFDLFYRPGPDQPLVLYAERHVPFTEAKRLTLAESHVPTLYIDAMQEDEYRTYLDRNLANILTDPIIDIQEKTEILYASALGVAQRILENPADAAAVTRSKELVADTVRFVFSEAAAFQNFVRATSNDYFTYTHSVNVCVFGLSLAIHAGYRDEEQLRDLGNGLLLHDIGKSRIDTAILESPGKLTNEQWIQLKQHPVWGEEMASQIGGVGPIALDVIRHHHEKLDGSGYPDRLRGPAITPFSRMALIVDVFDAMTTNRPFQRAASTFNALKVMRLELGESMDQKFLRLFINMLGMTG